MFGGGEVVRAVDGLPAEAFVRRQVSSTKPRMCRVHSTHVSGDAKTPHWAADNKHQRGHCR